MFKLPPKQQLQVLDETIEFVSAGSGTSTLVLVNGSGGPVEGWHRVFGPLTALARVFAYNRPGIGGSSMPARPQLASHLVSSLRAALLAAGLPPPYVLVGHSFGGLIVNLFARLHPAEVSALVLVEATAPSDIAVMAAHENALQRGLRRLLDRLVPPNPHAESEHAGASAAELALAPPFPALPLTVVTGGKPAMAWATAPAALAARAAGQRALVALSPLGRQVVAARSGHFPQFSEPQLLVDIVAEALGRRPG